MLQNIKVQNHRAIMYTVSQHERTIKLDNLNKRHGYRLNFSHKVAAKVTEIVESWANTVEVANLSGKNIKLKFITLTIPAQQIHCDKTISRKCLLPFLKTIGNYLYVVEKQENGNIHFHLVSDTQQTAKHLRSRWNNFLDRLGYVSEYQREKKELYKNGFILIDNGFSLIQQQLWYAFGQMSNWANPRTLDMIEIYDSTKAAGYLVKYMTKGAKSHICCNRWGANKTVKAFKSPKLERHQYSNEDVEELCSCASSVNNLNEFVTIIKCTNLSKVLSGNSLLLSNVKAWYKTQELLVY